MCSDVFSPTLTIHHQPTSATPYRQSSFNPGVLNEYESWIFFIQQPKSALTGKIQDANTPSHHQSSTMAQPPAHHHHHRQQQHRQPPAETPAIPPLVSISPSIFSPIEGDDLILPFTPPSSRVDRLYAKLDALEANRRRVRANMLALYRRECARIIQEAQAEERAAKDSGADGSEEAARRPSDEELDAMIANMAAKPTGQRPVPASAASPPQFDNFIPRSRREACTKQIEITISKGLMDLKGYDEHVATIRKGYTETLDREMQSAMDIDD